MLRKLLPAMLAIPLVVGGCTTREDLESVLRDIREALERTEDRTTTTVEYDIGWNTGTVVTATERVEANVAHYRQVEGQAPIEQAAIQMWPDHDELVKGRGTGVVELQRKEEVRYRSVISESIPGIDLTPWRVWAYFTDAWADIATLTIDAAEEFTDSTYTWYDEHTEIGLHGAFKYFIDLHSDNAQSFEGPTTRFVVSECLSGDLNNVPGDFAIDVDTVVGAATSGSIGAIFSGLSSGVSSAFGNCGYSFYGVADAQVGEVYDYAVGSQGSAKYIYMVSDETAETTISRDGDDVRQYVTVVDYWFYDVGSSYGPGSSGDLIEDCTNFWLEQFTQEMPGSTFATTNDTVMHECPARKVVGTQWWLGNLLVRNAYTVQRVALDNRSVYVSDIGSSSGVAESGGDNGFGFEVITNCDHDGDLTNDGPCRFFDTDQGDNSVAVGSATVDFTDPVINNDLVRYLHYIQVDSSYEYNVTAIDSIDAPAEDTATTP